MKCPMIIKKALTTRLLSRATRKATKSLRRGEKAFRNLGKTPELIHKNRPARTALVDALSKRDSQIRKFKSQIWVNKNRAKNLPRLVPSWKKQLIGA